MKRLLPTCVKILILSLAAYCSFPPTHEIRTPREPTGMVALAFCSNDLGGKACAGGTADMRWHSTHGLEVLVFLASAGSRTLASLPLVPMLCHCCFVTRAMSIVHRAATQVGNFRKVLALKP